MKTNTAVTENTFSFQPDESRMSHLNELTSLNKALSEALKCFYLVNKPMNIEYPYGEMTKKILDIEEGINTSIFTVSEAIGMLVSVQLAEQAMDTTEIE